MARAQKLKVFRTPIGFHDAYVAAPSRKAALAAWGSDVDLFARGVAEQVEDEALIREPLASPGKIIRRSRGTTAEQLAALPPDPTKRPKASAGGREDGATGQHERSAKPLSHGRRSGGESKTPPLAPPPKPKPRPSRKPLEDAERGLDELAERQRREAAALREEEQALARRRRETERRHELERATAEAAVERERSAYSEALARC